MNDAIPVSEIETFAGGRRLLRTLEAGTVPVPSKDGPKRAAFAAGAIVVADKARSGTIVGPVDFDAAVALARDVLAGNERAVTHPATLMTLAAALAGFSTPAPGPGDDETAEGGKPERPPVGVGRPGRRKAEGDRARTG